MTKEDAVSNSTVTARRSFGSVIGDHPVMFTLAALAGAAVVAVGTVLGGGDSDEAPIRVKNGSLELSILSTRQAWEPAGDSGNWRIRGARRFGDFDVTAAVRPGATCGPSHTATGADIVLTYSDNKTIRIESAGRRTAVKPSAGVTMTVINPQQISYRPSGTGFITQLAVGNGGNPTVLCSFSAANQLDHILILNVP
jgi:hypothetical protein